MACHYCLKRSVPHPTSGGQCIECSLSVCTQPQHFGPKKVGPHGALCECVCGKVVCYQDAIKHKKKESSGQDCFPGLSTHGATAVLVTAIATSQGRRASVRLSEDEVGSFNDFMNHVSPGHYSLVSTYAHMSEREVPPATRRVLERQNVVVLDLDREFFNEGTIERLVLLAARTAVESWQLVSTAVRDQFDFDHVVALDSATELWLQNRELSASLLDPLSQGRPPIGLVRALRDGSVPDGGTDLIASWLMAEPAFAY
jgi:hypothetical protein